jgi:hypothetical protein
VRFLLIERLDNFSLKLLFLMQMTKKDLTILIRLPYPFFYKKKKIQSKFQSVTIKLGQITNYTL